MAPDSTSADASNSARGRIVAASQNHAMAKRGSQSATGDTNSSNAAEAPTAANQANKANRNPPGKLGQPSKPQQAARITPTTTDPPNRKNLGVENGRSMPGSTNRGKRKASATVPDRSQHTARDVEVADLSAGAARDGASFHLAAIAARESCDTKLFPSPLLWGAA